MKKFLFGTCLILEMACKSGDSFIEVKDEKLTIQLTKLQNEEDVTESSYRLRILPDRSLYNDVEAFRHLMWYSLDSTVYIEGKNGKTYPDMIQPVSNGIKDSFEYLLVFNDEKNSANAISRLIYDDKYFTKKAYILDLDKK